MPKEDKSDVSYSVGHLHSHCGPTFHDDDFYCRHFIPGRGDLGTCETVAGKINPIYWCERYQRVKR